MLCAGARAAGCGASRGEARNGRYRQEDAVFDKVRFYLWGACLIVRIVCRPRLAVQRTMLRAMMAQDGTPSRTALWLLAYTWLLRLPSEALPMCVCASEPQRGVHQSAVWREGDNICVLLSSRKNLQGGSGVLRRACSCEGSPHMCPVHVLWEQFLDSVPVGTKPWLNVSAAQVLKWMRGAFIALAVRTSAC
jgi:hypothetical protein